MFAAVFSALWLKVTLWGPRRKRSEGSKNLVEKCDKKNLSTAPKSYDSLKNLSFLLKFQWFSKQLTSWQPVTFNTGFWFFFFKTVPMVVFQTMLKKSLASALNNTCEDCENKHPLIRVLESVCSWLYIYVYRHGVHVFKD